MLHVWHLFLYNAVNFYIHVLLSIDSFDQNVTLAKSNMTCCTLSLNFRYAMGTVQNPVGTLWLQNVSTTRIYTVDKFEAVLTLNNVVIHHCLSVPCQMTCYILHTNIFVYTAQHNICVYIYISFLSRMLVYNLYFYAAFTRSATVDMA